MRRNDDLKISAETPKTQISAFPTFMANLLITTIRQHSKRVC